MLKNELNKQASTSKVGPLKIGITINENPSKDNLR